MLQSGYTARAINNPAAAYCLLARSQVYQGRLHEAEDLLQKAAQLIHEAGGQYLGAVGLVEVETATLLCEWNDVEAALVRLKQGLDLLPWWGKADDFCLAYITLARIQIALGNRTEAAGAIEKATRLVQTCGVFSEARNAVEVAQVKLWLAQGDVQAANRWAAAQEARLGSDSRFRFENELAHITQARIWIAQNKSNEAIGLLSRLEEAARSAGRMGRIIEILLLEALAMQEISDSEHALLALSKCLALAEPEGYVRIFLDEGQPMRLLLAQWLAEEQVPRLADEQVHGLTHSGANSLWDYAKNLLSQFDAGPQTIPAAQEKISPARSLVEPLTPRELDVLNLLVVGLSNRQIAEELVLSEGTVKFYMHTILEKLGVHSRTQAIAKARELNLLDID